MDRRIRIAHVINSMEVGGAQRQVVNLMRTLDPTRFEQCLICLERKGVLGEGLERDGFPVLALGKQGRVHPKMLWTLVRELRRWKPDIVHTSVFTANLWGRLCAMAAGVPVRIAHEQSTVSLEKWYRRVMDWGLSWGTYRILAVSEDLRVRLLAEERLSVSRIEVLYNAVDCKALQFDSRKEGEGGELPGRPGFRVGLVGRLEYRKDHLTLVRAAARVVERMRRRHFFWWARDRTVGRSRTKSRRWEWDGAFFCWVNGRMWLGFCASWMFMCCARSRRVFLSRFWKRWRSGRRCATRVGGNAELLDEGRAGF